MPEVQANPGWGPCTSPEDLIDVHFAPFSKTDKLGRISDWLSIRQHWNNNNRARTYGSGTGQFGYVQEYEESSFSLVDNTRQSRDGRKRFSKFNFSNIKRRKGKGAHRRWGDNNNVNIGRGRGGAGVSRGGSVNRGRGGQNNNNNRWNNAYGSKRWGNFQPESKQPSIPIQESWQQVLSIDCNDLNTIKVRCPSATTLVTAGKVERYAANPYDMVNLVNPKNSVDLIRDVNSEFVKPSTSRDPILQQLMSQNQGSETGLTVYATDTILTVLMSAGKSVAAWDIKIVKKDGVIVLDSRPNSSVDFLTVNENWNEGQESDLNSPNHPTNLFKEATTINHNFSQQVLQENKTHSFDQENPFSGSENYPPVGYRYRKWRLANNITVVCRCEIHGYTVKDNEKVFLTIQALNDSLSGGIDWRSKLVLEPAAVLASEMKNNNCKLAKWASKAFLAGADELRLGFVTRVNPADVDHHQILMVRSFKADNFAEKLQMSEGNFWASLQRILDKLNQQDDGTYILLKDPNEPKLHLYLVPTGETIGEELEA